MTCIARSLCGNSAHIESCRQFPGTGLGLKHGSHLDLNQGHFDGYTLDNPGSHYRLCSRPANTEAHMSNLLLLMAQKMGVETGKFGDSNRVLDLA